MTKSKDWRSLGMPIKPTKDDAINEMPEWVRKLDEFPDGDGVTWPPDWMLEMAYEQASGKNSARNREAALGLLHMLKSCLLEEEEMTLTPKAREILVSLLTSICDGTDPAKALFLEPEKGHSVWINRGRNNGIVFLIRPLVDAGKLPSVAAKEVALLNIFRDPKTGKCLSAKTILNIWLSYKKNPWPRVAYGRTSYPPDPAPD